MGNKSSVEIEIKTWPEGTWVEKEIPISARNSNINTYQNNELLSFGRTDLQFLKKKYGNDFLYIDKGQNFFDGKRNDYSDPSMCCLTDINFITTNNGVNISCGDYTKNFSNSFCDNIMFTEVKNYSTNPKCESWIRSVVERQSKYFNQLYNFFSNPSLRNKEHFIFFMNALRDFATEKNNYNNLADEIILNYSDEIKNREYKCAFPSSEIIQKEKNSHTPKECFYKECVLTPRHKLLYSNIVQRERCTNTVCDIDIKKLNMNTQDLQIICKNKFQKNKLEKIEVSLDKDSKDLFFIPTFQNTLLPLFFLLSSSLFWIK